MTSVSQTRTSNFLKYAGRSLFGVGALAVIGLLAWQGVTADGAPDPTLPHLNEWTAILDTAVLVFREGLETVLVLATVLAAFTGDRASLKRPVVAGAFGAVLASAVTWFFAIGILSDLGQSIPALSLQAGTGLLAIVVLFVIMNWLVHKYYWTGWISSHGRRRKEILAGGSMLVGLLFLGFTSVYREGFEIVLFLQSLRLQVGSAIVLEGVGIGLFFTSIVGALTFFAHKKLSPRKMLVATGILIFIVLLVMVGEEAQEMQLAHWIPKTDLDLPIPGWAGVWFSLFPTIETLLAQGVAALIVLGSYFGGRWWTVWRKNGVNSLWS